MTSVRIIKPEVFEDHLTYPVRVGNNILELSGVDIKRRMRLKEKVLTMGEYDDIINEIKRLKEELNECRKLGI